MFNPYDEIFIRRKATERKTCRRVERSYFTFNVNLFMNIDPEIVSERLIIEFPSRVTQITSDLFNVNNVR